MPQQTRITLNVAMRVRDVSRPRVEEPRAPADPPPEPDERRTPPRPRKGERRRLSKRGGPGGTNPP